MSAQRTDYQYHRTGNGRTLHHSGMSRRQALQLVGYSLTDNGLAAKAEAQRFAATIKDDIPATYGPYTFTVRARGPDCADRRP